MVKLVYTGDGVLYTYVAMRHFPGLDSFRALFLLAFVWIGLSDSSVFAVDVGSEFDKDLVIVNQWSHLESGLQVLEMGQLVRGPVPPGLPSKHVVGELENGYVTMNSERAGFFWAVRGMRHFLKLLTNSGGTSEGVGGNIWTLSKHYFAMHKFQGTGWSHVALQARVGVGHSADDSEKLAEFDYLIVDAGGGQKFRLDASTQVLVANDFFYPSNPALGKAVIGEVYFSKSRKQYWILESMIDDKGHQGAVQKVILFDLKDRSLAEFDLDRISEVKETHVDLRDRVYDHVSSTDVRTLVLNDGTELELSGWQSKRHFVTMGGRKPIKLVAIDGRKRHATLTHAGFDVDKRYPVVAEKSVCGMLLAISQGKIQ